MRNLKRTILAAALLLSFSAAGAALGNDVSAASLQAAEPAGPVSNTGRDHRFDEHRQHRFDKDKDPGRGRPGGRHHDRGERKSAAMQPEDARF